MNDREKDSVTFSNMPLSKRKSIGAELKKIADDVNTKIAKEVAVRVFDTAITEFYTAAKRGVYEISLDSSNATYAELYCITPNKELCHMVVEEASKLFDEAGIKFSSTKQNAFSSPIYYLSVKDGTENDS